MLKRLPFLLILGGIAAVFFLSNRVPQKAKKAPLLEPKERAKAKAPQPSDEPSQNENAEEKSFAQIENEADFVRQFPGNWNFRRNDIGKIHAVTGGLIPGGTSSPEAAADLVKALAPLFAEGEFTVEDRAERISETQYIQSYNVPQRVKGRRVYQGSATVLGRKTDDSAYIVNNRLKDIFRVADEPLVQSEEAQRIASERLGGGAALETSGEVYVFSDDKHHSELAYVFQFSSGRESGDIVIGAETGRVLHREVRSRKN